MEEKGERLKLSFGNMLEIPREILMDLPKITLIGDQQFIMENHRGIIEFTGNKVRIAAASGEVEVRGNGLVIRSIFSEEIVLEGKIGSVSFVG
ncbi:hypothetical protein KKC1_25770 [Calderihabitans maritimus]|uniref:Sporulation protein YqfC n=2 Tax=Calderihabitans maritimus TaxID=1246530 RepID=A0A1Z5HV81_9FIRM|nr:hypothetical protein KKC1_25770 [Calderihabitans maritimus]